MLTQTLSLDGRSIEILPAMIEFHPDVIPWVLLSAHMLIIVTASVLVAGIRTALSRAEHELRIRAWHLRQMFAT